MNLNSRIEGLNVQEAWDVFTKSFDEATMLFVPLSSGTNKTKHKPLWINEKALKKVKKKYESFRRYMQTREGKDYLEYAKARNQAKSECRKAMISWKFLSLFY